MTKKVEDNIEQKMKDNKHNFKVFDKLRNTLAFMEKEKNAVFRTT